MTPLPSNMKNSGTSTSTPQTAATRKTVLANFMLAVLFLDKRFGQARERRPAVACREPEQAQEHLRREERVAAGRVAVVRNHVEHLAERVERELANRRPAGERAVALEVQRRDPSCRGCDSSSERPHPRS